MYIIIFIQFQVGAFSLRDCVGHQHYCELIEVDQRGTMGYSTTYGVNNRSFLMNLPVFDVTKCLPFDIMHTIFDGNKTVLELLRRSILVSYEMYIVMYCQILS